jgi:hypothetical protein
MNRILNLLWIGIFIFSSCVSNKKDSIDLINGLYVGTFQRQLAFGGGEIANVSITFTSNTWTGESDHAKYPALCNGTYKIENQKIIFTNACDWTADFNWSLILSGEYDLIVNGEQIQIIRSDLGPSTDTWTDKYILQKNK